MDKTIPELGMIEMPTILRIGLYRTDGRNGLTYDLPAMVTVTRESHPGDYPCRYCGSTTGNEQTLCSASRGETTRHGCDRPKNPLMVPPHGTVHLTVFTPGGFGTQLYREDADGVVRPNHHPSSEDFVGAPTFAPGSGTYVELAVPVLARERLGAIPSRSWRWPV